MARAAVPVTEAFGSVLRRLRSEAGLTQESLGAKSRLHRNYVGMLERGERVPSLATLESLARVLGLRPHELVKAAEDLAE